MQRSFVREDHGEGRRAAFASTIARVIGAVARPFTRPDLSLVNEKFTDTLERELSGQDFNKRNW